MVIFVEDKLKPGTTAVKLADALDIETTGGSTVQSELDAVGAQVSVGFGWLWANQVGGNPPDQSFVFNNALPASVTQLNLAQNSHSGRIDEVITRLKNNDFIFIQDTTNVTNSFLYRVTASPTLVSATFSYYTVPVEFERANGTYTPNAGDRWAFTFFLEAVSGQRSANVWAFNSRSLNCTSPTTFAASLANYTPVLGDAFIVATGGEPFAAATVEATAGDIFIPIQANPDLLDPTDWDIVRQSQSLGLTTTEAHAVEQFSERDRRVNAADASAPGESVFVRFWLRPNIIVPGGEGNPGTGLLIAEAQNGSFTQTSNDPDGILYIALDDAYVTNTGTSNLVVEITDPDGNIDQRLNLDTDFEQDDELTGAAGTIFHSTGASGGDFIRYVADQRIRVFRTTTDRHFQMTAAPVVDFTQNIENLPETRLSTEVRAKLNSSALTFTDQDKLDQFVADTTTSMSGSLPVGTALYYKENNPTNDLSDWGQTDVDTGIFGRFDSAENIYIAIDHRYNITGFEGLEGGSATLEETLIPSPLKNFNVYRFRFPAESSPTNFYLPVGTTITDAQYDATERIKIGQRNFDAALAADYQRLHEGELTPALQDFEDKLTVSHVAGTTWRQVSPFPLNSTITRRWAAFFDENRTGASAFSGNLFEDVANPAFNASPVFITDGTDPRFPGQDSFSNGRVDATGLLTFGTDFKKLFAFRFYIRDPDWTGNVPILKLGTRTVLRAIRDDPTIENPRNGLFVRVGAGDGDEVSVPLRQRLTQPNTANTIQYLEGTGAQSVEWSVPQDATFPLSLTFRMLVVDNGIPATDNTNVAYVITDPDVSQPQSSQTVTMNTPGPGTRDENFTFEYNGTTNILTWGTPELALNVAADVTRIGSEVTFDDTDLLETSNSTNDVALSTNVSIIQNDVRVVGIFEGVPRQAEQVDPFLQTVLVVNGHQENTINLNLRAADYAFDDWQFGPNSGTDVSVAEMQVYDFDFGNNPANAPSHSELYTLYTRQSDFLGLFVEPSRDFSQYTLDGNVILTDAMDNTYNIISRLTAPQFDEFFQAADLASISTSVILPADYTDFPFVYVVMYDGVGQWSQFWFDTVFLSDTDLATGANIGGVPFSSPTSNLRFIRATRALTVIGGSGGIWRVSFLNPPGGGA